MTGFVVKRNCRGTRPAGTYPVNSVERVINSKCAMYVCIVYI